MKNKILYIEILTFLAMKEIYVLLKLIFLCVMCHQFKKHIDRAIISCKKMYVNI